MIEHSKITEKVLLQSAKDLTTGRNPLKDVRLTDDIQIGLRFEISKTGTISAHASYPVNGRNPLLKIGDINPDSDEHISLSDARHLTQTIRRLSQLGVDPQDGLRKRLLAEIVRDGLAWRPTLSEPPASAGKKGGKG